MYGVDKNAGIYRINIRVYAMSEIEHMSRGGAKGIKDACYPLANDLGCAVERGRIEVALQCHTIPHAAACFADVS